MYGKCIPLRSFIRQKIIEVLQDETRLADKPYGFAEFLELLTSFIVGYSVPLKPDHVQLFEHCLMPLHRHRHIAFFRQNLIKAVGAFISKDESLIETAILSILKYWPVVNPLNEVASLAEIEAYLNLLRSPHVLADISLNLVGRIASCACSLNWMVAQRALYLLNSPILLQLLKMFPNDLVLLIVDGIGQNIISEQNQYDRLFAKNNKLKPVQMIEP